MFVSVIIFLLVAEVLVVWQKEMRERRALERERMRHEILMRGMEGD